MHITDDANVKSRNTNGNYTPIVPHGKSSPNKGSILSVAKTRACKTIALLKSHVETWRIQQDDQLMDQLKRSDEDIREGRTVSWEEAKRDLGW